jgi:uncharacterized repeat protein (TIGR03803 family)
VQTVISYNNFQGYFDQGVIFKIEKNGTGFMILHEFKGGGKDGAQPDGSLTLNGSTLYGMTYFGGDFDEGTVFSIGTDGSGFSLLHEFSGVDGGHPRGSLTLSGSTLYGMCPSGGENDLGVIFKMTTGGLFYKVLHEFSYKKGKTPQGSLMLNDSTLYGTALGGYFGCGVVFRIQTDGTGFSMIYDFGYPRYDVIDPLGSLVLSGTTLYGTAAGGGSAVGGGSTDDNGGIFSISKFNNSRHYVSSDGNCGDKEPCYSSIQNAVSKATNGSIILVKQGIYRGSISLEKDKSLLVAGGYNSTYDQQSPNTTFIQTLGYTRIQAPSGSLQFRMITIQP